MDPVVSHHDGNSPLCLNHLQFVVHIMLFFAFDLEALDNLFDIIELFELASDLIIYYASRKY